MNNTKDTKDTLVIVNNPIDNELIVTNQDKSLQICDQSDELQIGGEIDLDDFLLLTGFKL